MDLKKTMQTENIKESVKHVNKDVILFLFIFIHIHIRLGGVFEKVVSLFFNGLSAYELFKLNKRIFH